MITQQLRAFRPFVETYCAMRHLAPEQREDMPTLFRVTGGIGTTPLPPPWPRSAATTRRSPAWIAHPSSSDHASSA